MKAASRGKVTPNWRVVEDNAVGTRYADGPRLLVVYKPFAPCALPMHLRLNALDLYREGAEVCGTGGAADLAKWVGRVTGCVAHCVDKKYVEPEHGSVGVRCGRPNPSRRQRILHGCVRQQEEKMRLRDDRAARFDV